eukprot:6307198-Prymnesium_polylepis.1
MTEAVRMNHAQEYQYTRSVSHPHANVSRLAGLDYINRALGQGNFKAGSTVLVNSINPADDWRSLGFLNEWTLDGIVMSNDSPGYVMSSSAGGRNDQLFNVAIQGPAQVNNGFEDDYGRGIAANHSRSAQMAAGHMPLSLPEGVKRSDPGFNGGIRSLVNGPFYHQYPLQMFDRKVKPLSELYVGLVCKMINNDGAGELDEFLDVNPALLKESGIARGDVEHVHIFQYIPFSSRQAWQHAYNPAGQPDTAVRDTGDPEPAARRRGPLDPKRERDDMYMPRKAANAAAVPPVAAATPAMP